MRVDATLSAKRSNVENSRIVGKAEKSSGLVTCSATIRIARLNMMFNTKPRSSMTTGIGTTIRITSASVATGSRAPRSCAGLGIRRIVNSLAAELGQSEVSECRKLSAR